MPLKLFGYDFNKAYQNATQRSGNVLAAGGSNSDAIGAFFARNRTTEGNTLYNKPKLLASTFNTNGSVYGNLAAGPQGPDKPRDQVPEVTTPTSTGTGTAPSPSLNQGFQQSFQTNADTAVRGAESQANLTDLATQERNRLNAARREQTLGLIGRQRSTLSQNRDANRQLAVDEFGRNTNLAQGQANLATQDIDAALNQTTSSLQRNRGQVVDQSEEARIRTEDAIRRNFDARGAQDSTFYARALAEGLSGIEKQRADQLFQVDQAITTAAQTAASQKNQISQQRDATLAELEGRKNSYLAQLEQQYNAGLLSLEELEAQASLDAAQFATEQEIARIGQLEQISFNLDQYLNGLNDRRIQVQMELEQAGRTGANFNIDMSGRDNLLARIQKGLPRTQAAQLTMGGTNPEEDMLRRFLNGGV